MFKIENWTDADLSMYNKTRFLVEKKIIGDPLIKNPVRKKYLEDLALKAAAEFDELYYDDMYPIRCWGPRHLIDKGRLPIGTDTNGNSINTPAM